jgi:beta-galactosidase/beta-glucuronidase
MPPMPGEQDELITLMSLGGGLPERLLFTVARHWAEKLADEEVSDGPERNALSVALFGRVTLALRLWLGDPSLKPEVVMIGPAETPSLIKVDHAIEVRLPFIWLVDIWSRGLAVILDRFAVELVEEDDRQLELLTVESEKFEPGRLVIELGG